ncbi:Disks large-associated protein 2 [Acipenser ruthenus]|uniref:Disks large-associated protein 2 n=1 Tax=Acipenser ruthenus TaxID=7906 RepID=A0A444TW34_ACIRT|nr:Disks large-associated protein 2 [Acipenser ruthenus]
MMPMVMGDHISSSTFPRMHYSSNYDTRDDCAVSHAGSKINRIPANLLDQFEKQLPLHRDGFHTLQYQRTSTTEQRSESPGRIRHLVHSVQKLFTKSHSLEGSSKSNMNGTKGDSRGDSHHHSHHSKHSKRSKSKERKPDSKHRSGMGWWSSDDNLDSDSTYRTPSVMSRHHIDHISHCYPESMQGHFGDFTLKTSKSNNDVKCSACEGLAMAPEGKFMKRSSWSTLTVSQAKEAYRKSSLHLEKPMMHQDIKPSLRPCHYLQVPQDEWGGYPGINKDDEIPCRRMRSGSYIKAMGDDESGESDTSPKTSPKAAIRPDSLVKSAGQRPHGDHQIQTYHLHAARDMHPSVSLNPAANYNCPKFRSRNQSYMRAVSTLSQASCVSQVSSTPPLKDKEHPAGMQKKLAYGCQQGFHQAVTYTTSYKKTPPPVPPRTTSKPLISVTAQSSTESTQDAYHDSRHQRGGLWPLDIRGMYNSTDSLDSTKAVTLAMETAAGKRHASTDSHSSVLTSDKGILVKKGDEFLKSRRSSIGIQVETATDSESEGRGPREYHSVGVQVEDKKRHGRFKRSNSVTAAVQADLELEGFPSHVTTEDKGLQFGGSFHQHSEPSTPTQYGAVRTVRTQGLFSYREDYRAPVEPPSPQPEPWLVESPREVVETGRMSPCRLDGSWFMQLLHAETKRMEGWCKEMEREAEENDLSEEILGKIRSAVGSAQLLMSQKFQQFYWLCQQNLDPSAMPRPTSQDLAGFWDLLQLSIEDVSMKFAELQQIKNNDWRPIETPEKKEEKKIPSPIPKKPPKGKIAVTRERSLDLPDRQRQEARKRLMAAKRAASFRQNSATERADSIEIYIPEAQTRL